MELLVCFVTGAPLAYLLHRFLPNGMIRYVVCTLFVLIGFIASDYDNSLMDWFYFALIGAGAVNYRNRE